MVRFVRPLPLCVVNRRLRQLVAENAAAQPKRGGQNHCSHCFFCLLACFENVQLGNSFQLEANGLRPPEAGWRGGALPAAFAQRRQQAKVLAEDGGKVGGAAVARHLGGLGDAGQLFP